MVAGRQPNPTGDLARAARAGRLATRSRGLRSAPRAPLHHQPGRDPVRGRRLGPVYRCAAIKRPSAGDTSVTYGCSRQKRFDRRLYCRNRRPLISSEAVILGRGCQGSRRVLENQRPHCIHPRCRSFCPILVKRSRSSRFACRPRSFSRQGTEPTRRSARSSRTGKGERSGTAAVALYPPDGPARGSSDPPSSSY